MIRCLLVVAAESVVRDATSNVVSIFNVLDEINAQVFPLLVPKLSLLMLFERNVAEDPVEADMNVTFRLGGTQLFRGVNHLNFQGKSRLRSIMVLQGFILPTPGTLRVEVARGEAVLGVWEIPTLAVGGPQLALGVDPPGAGAPQ